jgi:hypothetical protein
MQMKITEQQKSSIRTWCGLISVIIQILVGAVVIWFDRISLAHK